MARSKLVRLLKAAWKKSLTNKIVLLVCGGILLLFLSFLLQNADMIAALGIIGAILCIVIFCMVFGPVVLILVGVSAGVGALETGADQVKSHRDSAQNAQYQALEKKRLRLQLLTAACALVGIVGLFVFLPLSLVAAAVYFLVVWPMRQSYRSEFKERIVRTGLEDLLQNVDFRPEESFPAEEVLATGIFDRADRVDGNDLIHADYGRIHFTQSDIFLGTITGTMVTEDADGQTIEVPKVKRLFGGRLMRFDFPEPFAEPVQVLSKNFRHGANSPSLLKTLTGRASAAALETELDSFNQRFHVFAEDAAKALQVLRPQMIDGINRLGEQIQEPMAFSFVERSMYVAIDLDGADSFEAKTAGFTTLTQQRETVKEEVSFILKFLEQVYVKAGD